MCTVVFLPKGNSYYFASLRDESPLRPKAAFPDIYKKGEKTILSPIDALAGGTWLGVTKSGTVIILLNGGIKKHVRQPNYIKSRGLIVTALLAADLPLVCWNLMDMQGIEPYTLVVWNEGNLYQLIWDGETKHGLKLKSNKSYIWSSSTLYNRKASIHRRKLFQQWTLMNMPVSKLTLLNFFTSFSDSENGYLINRNEQTKTMSYTFIELILDKSAEMHYEDFSSKSNRVKKIWFISNTKKIHIPKLILQMIIAFTII